MRHRFRSRVRLHREMSSPTFVPLTIFRGLAGVAFLCFGELFWMHMSRIGLEGEGKVLGTIALVLGATMVVGALCGAAGISFSADEGGRLPLLASVYLAAPLSLADLVGAITFMVKRSQVLRLDLEHEETHGGRPKPGPPSDVPESPQSRTDAFRRLYDTFVVLALAFSVLEALMFRLGRRRIANNAERWRRERGVGGGGSFLSTGALESLLDEEDVRHAGWEDWRGQTVQQSLLMEQRFEQLRRTNQEKNEGLLEHTRGSKNSL
eukprot:g12390.t1